ncbi:MAG: hypothetical protein A4S14_00630 [Proteobacteria bacterium SG_bin9]|nr:MAG: hypothetical protein A4S14_00630 [Proteobacteria bacterium SG_bin9]
MLHVRLLTPIIFVLAFASPACADDPLNAAPFSRQPCVLGEGPCTPSFCGVFNDGPCVPDIPFPYGSGDLRLTIESAPKGADADKYRKPDHDLNTLADLYAALRACWTPPASDEAREGMQMSVRFAFKRSGDVIATPVVTYATPGVTDEVRGRYRSAIDEALARCAPLSLTRALGNAIAGKPINIRYVDNRAIAR